MYDLDYKFEEIPLCLGKNTEGRRENIAFISGAAVVNVFARGKWDFEEINLEGPSVGDAPVTLKYGHPLWDTICDSINHSCGDEVYDATIEVCQPDPDRKHDLVSA